MDPHRVSQRQKQLDIACNTLSFSHAVERSLARLPPGRRLRRRALVYARAEAGITAHKLDPRLELSKRQWDGRMRDVRAGLHARAPARCRPRGFRPLREVEADAREAELLEAGKELGMELAVRSVWPLPASEALRAPATETARACTLWVPPPLKRRRGAEPASHDAGDLDEDPGMELHRLLCSQGGEGDELLSRISWAAAEASWTPQYDPETPPTAPS